MVLTERECEGWSSDGQVDWTEVCVDASLHGWVDLGCHHPGRIGLSMSVCVLVRVWLLAAALCHSVGWMWTVNVSSEDEAGGVRTSVLHNAWICNEPFFRTPVHIMHKSLQSVAGRPKTIVPSSCFITANHLFSPLSKTHCRSNFGYSPSPGRLPVYMQLYSGGGNNCTWSGVRGNAKRL